MKLVMAIVTVLSVPALALGAASYTLSGNVGSTTGVATIDINDLKGQAGVMSVNVGINTTEPCAGFDYALNASTDDVVKMTGRGVHLNYFYESIGDKLLFTTYNLLKTSALAEQNLGGTYKYTGGAWTQAQVTDCMEVNLQVDTAAVEAYLLSNAAYAIGIAPAGITGIGILSSGENVANIIDPQVPLAQVLITPEPASMLLLLGALPFLRRRR